MTAASLGRNDPLASTMIVSVSSMGGFTPTTDELTRSMDQIRGTRLVVQIMQKLYCMTPIHHPFHSIHRFVLLSLCR
jgi:hypothetical protein